MGAISRVFAFSPFEPLRHYAVDIQASLKRLQSLWEATLAGDVNKQERLRNEIATIGSHAAFVASDLLDHLSGSTLLPVRQEDLIALIEFQTAMVDSCQRVAATLGDPQFFLHESIRGPVDRFATQTISMAALSVELIGRLDLLVEMAFGGPELTRTFSLVEEIRDQQSECERLGLLVEQKVDSLRDAIQPAAQSSGLRLTSQLGQLADDVGSTVHRFRVLIATPHGLSRSVKRRRDLGRICPDGGRSRKLRPIVGSAGSGRCPAQF